MKGILFVIEYLVKEVSQDLYNKLCDIRTLISYPNHASPQSNMSLW